MLLKKKFLSLLFPFEFCLFYERKVQQTKSTQSIPAKFWKVLFYAICIYLHTSFVRMKHLAMQTGFHHLPPYMFAIAEAIQEMDMRLNNFEQSLRVKRVPPVTILARETRVKIFLKVDQTLEMLSVAGHDIGARNAIEIFLKVDQTLEMLWVPLVTILAREMRLKLFSVGQALEMLRVPLVTILAREMRLKFFF